jgi:hypothetical protein
LVFNSPSAHFKKVICHVWSDIAYGHGKYRRIMVENMENDERKLALNLLRFWKQHVVVCKLYCPVHIYVCQQISCGYMQKTAVHLHYSMNIYQSQFLVQKRDLISRKVDSFLLLRDSQDTNWTQIACIFINLSINCYYILTILQSKQIILDYFKVHKNN